MGGVSDLNRRSMQKCVSFKSALTTEVSRPRSQRKEDHALPRKFSFKLEVDRPHAASGMMAKCY